MAKETYVVSKDRDFKNTIRFIVEEGPIFEEWQAASILFMQKLVAKSLQMFPDATAADVFSTFKDVYTEWTINGPDGTHYPGFALLVMDEEQGKVVREALKESGTAVTRRSKV